MTPQTQLQREIRQKRPFESAGHEALLGLFRTADAMGRALAAVIEPRGITRQQYNVLRILRGAQPDPLPVLEIGERMIEQTPGITRLLDRLEAKGLVSRTRCPTDRRQVHCRITPAGADLLTGLDPAVRAAGAALMRPLAAAEQKQMAALLDRLRTGLDTAQHLTSRKRE